LTALLGKENVAGPTLSSLSQNFGLAPLIGKPLAIISDARLSARSDIGTIVERLLAITGEDGIDIDRKFRTAWSGKLPTRFVVLTNEIPRLSDTSGALASRFIVLSMKMSFYGREDVRLTERLLNELPGILKWSLAGYDRLMARGHFLQPRSAAQAVRTMEDLGSPTNAFLRDCCDIGPAYSVDCQQLFDAWLTWCREQNRDHPGTVQTFGRDLRAAIPGLDITQPRVNGERERRFQGVRIAAHDPSAGTW
jgi:putative DNA primase/helicase